MHNEQFAVEKLELTYTVYIYYEFMNENKQKR
jgi:hypothetical protein